MLKKALRQAALLSKLVDNHYHFYTPQCRTFFDKIKYFCLVLHIFT